ncbi:MAG: adenosylcobinamide-GDP ribazoletransferase [Pseudomonadota bacterium]
MTWLRFEIAACLFALQFLTRIPIPAAVTFSESRFAAAPRYYPLVGGLIGVLCAGVLWAAGTVLPWALAVILSIAAGALLTGAFHEDGLADTFDGIGGGVTKDKALLIMKDSRIGTYGGLALLLAIGAKAASLTSMPVTIAFLSLVAAHSLSRLSSLVVIATANYQRGEGTAKPVSDGISLAALAAGASFAAFCALPLVWTFGASPLGYGLCGLVTGHILMRAIVEPKIGGYTGDTLGGVQQLSELGFYCGIAAWLSH